jgi:membrane-bound metal-dependent hydrolase YbcI (DUF457 family)
MPSSLTHALLPAFFAGFVSALFPFFPKMTGRQWALLLIASVFLGNSPDLDIIPAALFPEQWNDIHREWGHNIFSISLLIAGGTYLILRIIPSGFSWRRALWMSAFLVGSHITLDAMMNERSIDGVMHRPGVPLFFPFTKADYSLPWAVFHCWEAPDPGSNPIVAYASNPINWKTHVVHELATVSIWVMVWAIIVAALDYFWRKWRSRTRSRRWRANESAASSSSGSSK